MINKINVEPKKPQYEIVKLTRDYIDNLPPVEFNDNSKDYKIYVEMMKALAKK